MANPADIVDIIQTPVLIKDDFIKRGHVLLDGKQNPIHYTGGFAIVFPFMVDGEKWAFRCWYNSLGNVGQRLKTLSAELDRLHLPYFCKFQYVDQGIVLDGAIKPTTRMLWVDGLNIKDYICRHAANRQRMENLAGTFLTMCKDLHRAPIAHGDLQHGNIIIDDSGHIFLIDYDSVFLPALQGVKDIITGLPAYQHPSRIRRENIYANEKLDYFSELIIYTCIVAISKDPSLVSKFNIASSDNLLFVKEDFQDLRHSRVYQYLQALDNETIQLLDIMQGYLMTSNIQDLKPFESFLGTNVIKPKALYCIDCGQKFGSEDERFCIRCGKPRLVY